MKTLKISLLLMAILLSVPQQLFAQEDSNSQAYWVHEDPVYPAKVSDYEEYCTTLASKCKEYNIQEANWFTISTNDLKYFHVSPIQNMADLDKSRFSVLQDKMGEDDFNKLFDGFDECYDTHIDYIIHLDHELSYMPGEITPLQEGLNYRELDFYYVTPQNFDKFVELAKEFKALFVKKKSKEYFRVYRSGFGAPAQYLMVATSAANAEDFARIKNENKILLGAERDRLFDELMKLIIRTETLTGYMRMDLSYSPSK